MPSTHNWNSRKLTSHTTKPTVNRAVGMYNIGSYHANIPVERCERPGTHHPFHGKGYKVEPRICEGLAAFFKWTSLTACYGNPVASLQKQGSFLKYANLLPSPSGGGFSM